MLCPGMTVDLLYGAENRSQSGKADVTQKVTVACEDDLDGGPADETVWFRMDGIEYEYCHSDSARVGCY